MKVMIKIQEHVSQIFKINSKQTNNFIVTWNFRTISYDTKILSRVKPLRIK